MVSDGVMSPDAVGAAGAAVKVPPPPRALRDAGRIALAIATADFVALMAYLPLMAFADMFIPDSSWYFLALAGLPLLVQAALTVAALRLGDAARGTRRSARASAVLAASQALVLVAAFALVFADAFSLFVPGGLLIRSPVPLLLVLALPVAGTGTIAAGLRAGERRAALVDTVFLAFLTISGVAIWSLLGPWMPVVAAAPWWSLHALAGAVLATAIRTADVVSR